MKYLRIAYLLFLTFSIACKKDKIPDLDFRQEMRNFVIRIMQYAEGYRYYWQPDWKPGDPEWLDEANPDWPGNYKVHYWDPAWQAIIYGNDNCYLKRILNAGFDGVYLDIIEAFEYFEN